MRVLLRIVTFAGDVLLTDGPPLVVSDRETGKTYRFVPGLVVDDDALTRSLSWLSSDTGARRVSVDVLGSQGMTIEGRAEVSRLLDDADDYADRETVIRGEVVDVKADSHVWSAVIEDDDEQAQGQLLDDRAVVDTTTWPRSSAQRIADGDVAYVGSNPGMDPRAVGGQYPIPIGYPGRRPAGDYAGGIYGTEAIGGPGYLVEIAASAVAADQTILIAGERVVATQVRRISEDTSGLPTTETLSVSVAHDTRGRPVSVVKPSLSRVLADTPQWIVWLGGGIYDPYGPGVLRRADHVIRWALDRSDVRYDRSQISALDAVRHLQVDTVLTGQVRAIDWLRSQLLPLLPLSEVRGPEGVYYWPWLIADSRDATMTLEVGQNAARPDKWRRPRVPGVSRVTIAYAHDARSGLPTRRWTVAGRRRADDPTTEVGLDPWAARAAAVYGERSEEIEAQVICDDATAQHIARWRLHAGCRPRLDADLFTARDARLRPGARVRVIDAGQAVDTVAEVTAVRYIGDNDAQVTARIWPLL